MVEERSRTQDIYHLRVKGNLDEKWTDWFEGFVMASRDNGETLLSGAVVDQAALHGVLAKIHSLGLPLLLVARSGCPCSSKNCPRRGRCRECVDYHGEKGKLPYCFRAKTRWDKRCTAVTEAK
ncbi:MAG: hypothetical protein PVF47_10680 [Anaerolineae bacterium]|jgi:hypothetical protein